MNTEKQLIANQQNALLSTGPITAAGKAVVGTNAIKHGIFTKGLIVSSQLGQESEEDYQAILNNLIDCLLPCNQMESLLVEKIAVDFWRLRRTISFETGSIVKYIKSLLNEFYSYGNQTNEKIDEEIKYKQKIIAWNLEYIECLAKGEVSFDKPQWKGNEINSDIFEDFLMIAKSISTLTKNDRERLYYSEGIDFEDLRALLKKNGFSEAIGISSKLIELFTQQNQRIEVEIQKLSKQKDLNLASNNLTYMLDMTPPVENTEKILKYERSLQKSIFQNLLLLKKLQGAL